MTFEAHLNELEIYIDFCSNTRFWRKNLYDEKHFSLKKKKKFDRNSKVPQDLRTSESHISIFDRYSTDISLKVTVRWNICLCRSMFQSLYVPKVALYPSMIHFDNLGCNVQSFFRWNMVTCYINIQKLEDLIDMDFHFTSQPNLSWCFGFELFFVGSLVLM